MAAGTTAPGDLQTGGLDLCGIESGHASMKINTDMDHILGK